MEILKDIIEVVEVLLLVYIALQITKDHKCK